MGRGLAVGVVLVIVGLAAPAVAQQPVSIQLEYDRREGATACPDVRAVAAGVAGRLGYEPFDAKAARRVRVTVRRKERALSARIEMIESNGEPIAERVLTSQQADCAELAATMELAIAIAIDPFHAAAPERGPKDERPPPLQVSQPASARTATAVSDGGAAAKRDDTAVLAFPASAPAPGEPIRGQVALAAIGEVGSAPVRNFGLAVRVGARRGKFSLGIEGRADLPASVPLKVGDVSTSLLVASLIPCLHVRSLSACGLVTGGALRAAGHGLADARQVDDPYVAVGARLGIDLPVTDELSLAAYGDLSAPLVETQLKVGGAELWTTPPISFLLGIGTVFTFQ